MTKASGKPARKPDRRVRQTRGALGDALVKLMHETPFEEITVPTAAFWIGAGREPVSTLHALQRQELICF